MSTFLERLIDEETQLAHKTSALGAFIDTNHTFTTLSKMQQVLLVTQLNAMKLYLYTLQERIWDLHQKH